MTTEKLPVKVMLTIIEATDPQDVPNKTYKKMSVRATTDRTGEQAFVFFTFIPSFMEIIKRNIGKSLECEVFLDEHKIVGIRDDKALLNKEESIEQQTAVKEIGNLQAVGTITVAKDLLNARDSWLRHALREFIK